MITAEEVRAITRAEIASSLLHLLDSIAPPRPGTVRYIWARAENGRLL